MQSNVPHTSVDYLVIGHVAHDLTPSGSRLGGTVAYAALTARALGLKVGIVTSAGNDVSLELLSDIPLLCFESETSTTYENTYTEHGRVQYVRGQASRIDLNHVPDIWKNTPIVHLGPIANEVDAVLPKDFSPKMVGLTPQGWMRGWDSDGLVSPCEWQGSEAALSKADITIISREDVEGDDELIEHMAGQTKILVVTEGADGAVLYWHGDRRRYRAPHMKEVDATGAGDIFAAAFFARYANTLDPWEATRFATLLASYSVARVGLDGIPTRQEIEDAMMVVIQ